MTVLRTDIERALDDMISNEEGMRYVRGHRKLAKPLRSSLAKRFPRAHPCTSMADFRRRGARTCDHLVADTQITCENVRAPELAHGELRAALLVIGTEISPLRVCEQEHSEISSRVSRARERLPGPRGRVHRSPIYGPPPRVRA